MRCDFSDGWSQLQLLASCASPGATSLRCRPRYAAGIHIAFGWPEAWSRCCCSMRPTEPLALVSDRRAVVLVAGRPGRAGCLPRRLFRLSLGVARRRCALHRSAGAHGPHPPLGPDPSGHAALRAIRRDGGRLCLLLREPADTIDHVIPRSRGGDARLVQCRGRLQAGQPDQRPICSSPNWDGRCG